MHHPLAYCPDHGIVPAIGIGFAGHGYNNSIIGCSCSCPVPGCSRVIEIIPGVYNHDQEAVTVSISPSISPQALRALEKITKDLASGKISQEQADQLAETLPDEARRVYRKARTLNGPVAAVVASLITSIAGLAATTISGRSIIRAAEIQAEATIEASKLSSNRAPDNNQVQSPPIPRLKPAPNKNLLLQSTAQIHSIQ